MNLCMGFSEQLKKARLNIGYTQQQVADLMGITKSTYCGYETGKRQPDVSKIKQLASILNTSGDILLETGFDTQKKEPSSNKEGSQEYVLSDEELKLIQEFRKLPAEQRKFVIRSVSLNSQQD